MTQYKNIIIFLLLSVLTSKTSGQSLSLFDTKLNSEKITLCDLLTKYVDTKKEFKFTPFDTDFFSISSYTNNSTIFGYWSYVIRHDSLNQYGFSSLTLPINSEWFKKLNQLADSVINLFTIKYGTPIKDTVAKNNFYRKDKKYRSGDIRKAMWLIDGQKLKVDFFISGEHEQYSYLLRILRFKDYYGNSKIPPWWDGY